MQFIEHFFIICQINWEILMVLFEVDFKLEGVY